MNSLNTGRKTLIKYSTLLNPKLQLLCYHRGSQSHTDTTTDDGTPHLHSCSIKQRYSVIPRSLLTRQELHFYTQYQLHPNLLPVVPGSTQFPSHSNRLTLVSSRDVPVALVVMNDVLLLDASDSEGLVRDTGRWLRSVSHTLATAVVLTN